MSSSGAKDRPEVEVMNVDAGLDEGHPRLTAVGLSDRDYRTSTIGTVSSEYLTDRVNAKFVNGRP